MTNRRIFLRNSALAMVGVGAAPLWLKRALYAADAPSPRKKILVAIFQRGAVDGLNVVVPHGEKAYYDLRPTIAIPRPNGAQRRRDRSRWLLRTASLACAAEADVRRAASGDRRRRRLARSRRARTSTRRTTWNRARRASKATDSGWMNRALPKIEGKESPVRAVVAGIAGRASAARDREPALALQSIAGFPGAQRRRRRSSSRTCTRSSKDPLLQAAGRETFEAVTMLQSIQKQPYVPANGANYRGGRSATA